MAQRFIGAYRLTTVRAKTVVAAGAWLMMFHAMHAHALQSCTGTYSAMLLHPLTEPTVVRLDLADSSGVPTGVSQAFTSGMQAAGVTVSGTPTARLTLSYQVVGQGGGDGGGGGLNTGGGPQTGWSSWSGGGAAALQGGQTLALPDIPNYDAFSPAQPVQSALLMLRAEARNLGADTPDWVAVLQCTMQGTDNQTLAYQLGHLIGDAIGKRRDNSPM
jgi:hypothetical protein